jgi:hypothetical protein
VAERDVKVNGHGRKVLRHPDAGAIAVQFETLTPLQDPDQLLVIYRAADAGSQWALDRLNRRSGMDTRTATGRRQAEFTA